MKRKLQTKLMLSIVMILATVFSSIGQVTTSRMAGVVKDTKGETLPGASVVATHIPSGSVYSGITNKDGLFNIPAMRIGGPYKVEVSYIGFQKATYNDVVLALGQQFVLNVTLSNSGIELKTVVVSAAKGITSAKLGASTNVNRTAIATLPTFSRSITDFTRLTPQSTGTSFAGRDSRYNNTTVDGASVNNSFGLSSDPLPGGGAQPISIEAYDEVSINIAPFDVRQSGFTGAGIFATTRSGTNTFHGSVYGFYKDQTFNGKYIGANNIGTTIAKSQTKTYGATVGGPIIKNKLFFFLNYEKEVSEIPGIAFSPTGGSGAGIVAATPVADLKSVSDYLATKNYATGGYDNFDAFKPQNEKFLAKLDWNINSKNKFTVKYSYLNATSDNPINGASIANNGSYTPFNATTNVAYASRTNLPNSRYSNQSIAFQNSNYGFQNKVITGTAELNTTISTKLSNQLLFAFKKNSNPRTFPGAQFPTIDIFNGLGSNYITAGMDPFTNNNDVIDNTTSITDNLTYYTGKHTLTAGVNYEYQRIGNAFMPGSNSHYLYNSLNDFLTDKAPIYYSYTYSLIPGESKVFSANLKVGQLSFYAQDEYNASDRLKLTFGLRADKPIFLQDPVENPQISALQLPDQNGVTQSYNTGKWPSIKTVFSPRVGFRARLLEDNSLVVRGGTGIFTGRVPYVFLTNSPSNTAMYQFGAVATAAQLAGIKFNADPTTYASLFPQVAGTAVQGASVVIDPNYKFPQVFRTDLGIEKNLGNGFTATFEALYTKDIYASRMRNANLKTATGVINEGDLTRVRYVGTGTNNAVQTVDNRIYPNLTSVIVLENTTKGYSTALTAQITKSFKDGFNASAAYTYTASKEVTANPGSTAASVWNSNPNVGTSNDLELGNSGYYVPHRVVAYASYKFDYLKHGSTSFGVYYQGSAGGSPISYTINGDLNGDGNSADLMYIPKRGSDLTFTAYNQTTNGIVYTFTPQMQAAALDQFINNSPYLSKHRGEYAERNAAFTPWYNRIDATASQEFYVKSGKDNQKHTIQFNATLVNLPNLLNKFWGIQKTLTYSNPLSYVSIDANGVPTYNMRNLNGRLVNTPFQDSASPNTTWSLLLGAKYIF